MSAMLDNFELIPDPQLAKKLGKSLRTFARWDAEPASDFPAPVVINKRKHRRVVEIEAWLNRRAPASLGSKEKQSAK